MCIRDSPKTQIFFKVVFMSPNISLINSLCNLSTSKYLLLVKIAIDLDYITVLYYKSRGGH